MQVENKFFNWVLNRSDLLAESTPGAPLVEIVGNNRLLIENHCGVADYGRNEIHVKVSYGAICVQGTCLQLVQMSKQQLLISGCINSVCLLRGDR